MVDPIGDSKNKTNQNEKKPDQFLRNFVSRVFLA